MRTTPTLIKAALLGRSVLALASNQLTAASSALQGSTAAASKCQVQTAFALQATRATKVRKNQTRPTTSSLAVSALPDTTVQKERLQLCRAHQVRTPTRRATWTPCHAMHVRKGTIVLHPASQSQALSATQVSTVRAAALPERPLLLVDWQRWCSRMTKALLRMQASLCCQQSCRAPRACRLHPRCLRTLATSAHLATIAQQASSMSGTRTLQSTCGREGHARARMERTPTRLAQSTAASAQLVSTAQILQKQAPIQSSARKANSAELEARVTHSVQLEPTAHVQA